MLKGQGIVILLGQPGSQGSIKDLYLHDPVSAELQLSPGVPLKTRPHIPLGALGVF